MVNASLYTWTTLHLSDHQLTVMLGLVSMSKGVMMGLVSMSKVVMMGLASMSEEGTVDIGPACPR
jgi:hypothetical protein